MKLRLLLPFALLTFCLQAEEFVYHKPAKEILDILHAPTLPTLSVNPSRTHAVLSQSMRYPPISEVAAPMVRIAGLRIDPKTNGIHLAPSNTGMSLKRLSDGNDVPLALPANAKLSAPRWSPDGKHFAFTNTTANSIDLWLCDVDTGKTHKVDGIKLNAVLGDPIDWLDDSKSILLKTIPAGRGGVPVEPMIPKGPNVQEANGRSGPVRTYEDMLSSQHDENLFDYYATAQLVMLDTASGKTSPMGKSAIFQAVTPSPDGKDFLIERLRKPYSYLHPYNDFPREVEIWDRSAKVVYKVASIGLADRVPIEGVRPGPRNYSWKTGDSATMMWVEALDGGNPKEKVPNRDRVVALSAPFQGEPKELLKTQHRFRGIRITPDGKTALVDDYERERRWVRTVEIDLKNPGAQPKVVFSRNQQDRYKDPGTPVMKGSTGGGGFGGGGGGGFGFSDSGERAIQTSGEFMFLTGLGASPEGDRPFLDKYNLTTGKSERLFHSAADCYEQVVALISDDGTKVITRRETPSEPPNFYLKTLPAGRTIALTNFKDPAPQLRKIKKELVTYKRPDG
ncbi:MAG: S9 family peptidase, partial [Bryobacteraceae bacterium]